MHKVIVTGAAGFAGCNLTEHLLDHGYYVYAVVRPGSDNNERLRGRENLKLIECDMSEASSLPELIGEPCDGFFHLGLHGARPAARADRRQTGACGPGEPGDTAAAAGSEQLSGCDRKRDHSGRQCPG